MNRYNQGFGKFGPMEQCKDGLWIKYKDHVLKLKLVVANNKVINKRRWYWFDAYHDLVLKRDLAGLAAIVGWAIISVALIQYAFTGHLL